MTIGLHEWVRAFFMMAGALLTVDVLVMAMVKVIHGRQTD